MSVYIIYVLTISMLHLYIRIYVSMYIWRIYSSICKHLTVLPLVAFPRATNRIIYDAVIHPSSIWNSRHILPIFIFFYSDLGRICIIKWPCSSIPTTPPPFMDVYMDGQGRPDSSSSLLSELPCNPSAFRYFSAFHFPTTVDNNLSLTPSSSISQ